MRPKQGTRPIKFNFYRKKFAYYSKALVLGDANNV
jgi:hypothetical protein